MTRKLRYVPSCGSLVEVTCRTQHGRFLLRPSRDLNEIVVGVLARALERHPLELVAAVFLSNHFHLLVRVPDARRLAAFMAYLDGNLAREVGRLRNWRQRVWARRYDAILVSDEEEAQVARLAYLLAHGVKEGLVHRPEDWPGVHCATSLRTGAPLRGWWFDRSREYARRRTKQTLGRYECAQPMQVKFSKLPCWRHLTAPQYRERIAELLARVTKETRKDLRTRGGSLPSASTCRKRVLRQHPHARAERPERRTAPAFHAFRPRVRREMIKSHAEFVAAFRLAAERLRSGDREARFPPGCFPPGLPFVPLRAP